jgi:hypothetical protein
VLGITPRCCVSTIDFCFKETAVRYECFALSCLVRAVQPEVFTTVVDVVTRDCVSVKKY